MNGVQASHGLATDIRVLIADDEKLVRDALADLIRATPGMTPVSVCASAEEAIEAAKSLLPDVALVDVRMPGGGPMAARGIVEWSPTTRVLALSASGSSDTVLEMLQAGAAGYLVKGSLPSEVTAGIRHVASGASPISPEVAAGVVDHVRSGLLYEEEENLRRERVREQLTSAIHGDGLAMVYQPVLDLFTGEVAGMEALARFSLEPKRPPNEWFSDAGDLGVGVQLEMAAVARAIAERSKLPRGAFLAVNLSPEALMSPEPYAVISEAIADRVVIELTEHTPVRDYAALSMAFAPLRAAGAVLAIDDEGAGFASLRHLLELAPRYIKLDISITQKIEHDRAAMAMAMALTSFASGVDAEIIAEGIETEGQLEAAKALGIRLGQGYLLARPGPIDQPIAWAPTVAAAPLASIETSADPFLQGAMPSETLFRNQAPAEHAQDRWAPDFFDLAVDLLVVLGFDGYIKRLNPAWERTLGFNREELMAKSFLDFVHPEDRQSTEAEAAKIAEGATLLYFENRYLTNDGGWRWIAWTAEPKLDDGVMIAVGRDITARKVVEMELAESDQRLRGLMLNAPVGVVTCDLDGRITFLGGSVYTALGLDPASVVGQLTSELFAGRPDIAGFWMRALTEEFQVNVAYGDRFFDTHFGPYRLDRDGPIVGALMVAVDSTERTEAERGRRQSEELFQSLFEQAAVGIAFHNLPRGDAPLETLWNPRMLEILRVQGPADASTWVSMLSPSDANDAQGHFQALLNGDVPYVGIRRLMNRPDGTGVWVDLTTTLARDEHGTPIRTNTMAVDVSAQVAAAAALEAVEELAAQTQQRRVRQQGLLLQMAQAGLEGLDPGDFLELAVELVVRGTETHLGSLLELPGGTNRFVRTAAYGLADDETQDSTLLEVSDSFLETLRTNLRQPISLDAESDPPLSRSQWMTDHGVVAAMAVGLYGMPNPFAVLSVHSTAEREFSSEDRQFLQLAATLISMAMVRKQTEQQRRDLLGRLVSAQEAERRSIAADIHDDAVQVMTAANMRLEVLRTLLTDSDQAAAAEVLQETISLATGRLRNLLFSLSPPSLDRHGLAAGLSRFLEVFQADYGVTTSFDSNLEAEPPQALRMTLFRIFQEALANVGKHSGASSVAVSLATVEQGVEMRIRDNGIGFDPQVLAAPPGHLGVVSMRERAEMEGGWIRITSEPGAGADVRVWVPCPKDENSDSGNSAKIMALS